MIGPAGVRAAVPPRLALDVNGVPVTIHHRPLQQSWEVDDAEAAEFLQLVAETFDRFQPDVLLTYGGDRITRKFLADARRQGITTIFALHNFCYHDRSTFADVDVVLVPSQYSAEHYRRTLGIECVALPYLVDTERVCIKQSKPTYLTFVNPSSEKGVFPFARIANELGRLRPDIPILVVESRGTEETLVGCRLDLRIHGNVFLMTLTPDPREFWEVTRVLLMPSLFLESQGLAAVEAMLNGIPVIASDRGALPETLGEAGLLLPLPERLTPSHRELPTAEEVAPWVEAVLRLWDDAPFYEEHRQRALAESRRWAPEVLEPRYEGFFRSIARGPVPATRLG